MSAAEISVHIEVAGGVQGVGYRAWCQRKARELNLSGWVRNRSSGQVEAVFCGPVVQIDAMVKACHTGPHGARVEDLAVRYGPDHLTGAFEIRDTV